MWLQPALCQCHCCESGHPWLPAVTAFLTLLPPCSPAQAFDDRLVVKDAARRQFQDELFAMAPIVLQKLNECVPLLSAGTGLVPLFSCFTTWLKFCNVRSSVVVSCGLLPVTFAALSRPELFDAAVECIVVLASVYCNPNMHSEVIGQLIQHLALIDGLYDAGLKAGDSDVCKGCAWIFATFAENMVPLILGEGDMQQHVLVEKMVKCTSHPDVEVAAVSFKFWEEMSDSYACVLPPCDCYCAV